MISVIVPVYKAEKYLRRCIDSILAQTYTDFELLLIDDGSPDRSGEICDEYAKQDSRVRVFHKPNGGVSSARNMGLDNARGEWITFVDADDYIHSDFLKEYSRYEDVDLVVGSFEVFGTDDKWAGILKNCTYNHTQILRYVARIALHINFRVPWVKLFKRNIIRENSLYFNEKVFYAEDWLFVLNYLEYTKSIYTGDRIGYFYNRSNTSGLSQNVKYFDDYFYAMDVYAKTINRMKNLFGEEIKDVYKECLRGYCSRQVNYLFYSKESLISKMEKLKLMCDNSHLKVLFRDTKTKRRKKIQLFHKLMLYRLKFIAYIYIILYRGHIYD